jgi:hypothetical protein
MSLDQINDHWYAKATVRSTPRIIVPDYDGEQLIYPVSRCAMCEHPIIQAHGKRIKNYVLTQAAYQFLYNVGLLETKFIIQCCLDMLHDKFPGIGEVEKLQALTVIIDEGYHAHVALDYLTQMNEKAVSRPSRCHIPTRSWMRPPEPTRNCQNRCVPNSSCWP